MGKFGCEVSRPQRVLVTGGAGFIGTHLVRRLLDEGHAVTVLDSFSQQVHLVPRLPEDLAGRVRLIHEDIIQRNTLQTALEGQDVVVHLAAETGTGQSMYCLERYERTNGLGTAILLDILINDQKRSVSKIVLASSRAIYGEGKYRCAVHGDVYPGERSVEAMSSGRFEPSCPHCGGDCSVMPTDEMTPARPLSFYGLNKYMQEQAVLMLARAGGMSAYALRYQNVYGPGQSLKNPYTGILAIFSSLARQQRDIEIFEDGAESRDFVYIDDVVDATSKCVASELQGLEILNIGSGKAITVLEVATAVRDYYSSSSALRVTGAFRKGDIRHNIADIAKATKVIGFKPTVDFNTGVKRFLDWASDSAVSDSGYQKSIDELRSRGLMGN
jgi:dTDP-L-rhamnose 4-epimerase